MRDLVFEERENVERNFGDLLRVKSTERRLGKGETNTVRVFCVVGERTTRNVIT